MMQRGPVGGWAIHSTTHEGQAMLPALALAASAVNVTDAPLASTATPAELQTGAGEKATAANRDELYGSRLFVSDARLVLSDVRIASLLADDAYERIVAKVSGLPREKQSPLVKMLMTGALLSVLGGYAARLPHIHPSSADAAIGASVLNTAFRGIAGAPSRNMPAAGLLIGLAVLGYGIRRAAARSSHDVHTAVHAAETRYGHHSATSVAAERTARP